MVENHNLLHKLIIRTKNWIEVNNNAWGTYNNKSQNKFKVTKLNSSLCNYNDAYIRVRGAIKITWYRNDTAAQRADKRNTQVTIRSCVPFTESNNEINYIKINNAKDLDVVMPMYNLIEYSDNYCKNIR